MTTWYVYAFDYWGGRTYFKVDGNKLSKACQEDHRLLAKKLREMAAVKLGVPLAKTTLGQYHHTPFDQGHLPANKYKKGKWVSATVD